MKFWNNETIRCYSNIIDTCWFLNVILYCFLFREVMGGGGILVLGMLPAAYLILFTALKLYRRCFILGTKVYMAA